MQVALVSVATSGQGFPFARLLVIIVLLGIGFPLVRKLRRAASESRRRRWVEDGLMDPPADGPDPDDQSK